MAHELSDDTLYTSALPSTARLWGALSATADEPTSFGREAILNYLSGALAAVASSGSASDLLSGTLPLGRLHAFLQDIANIASPTQGSILYFDGTDFVVLAPGTSGQVLTTNGSGANPTWETGGSSVGDVTAAAAFGTDNRLVRSDGAGKGVQGSGISVSDSDVVSGLTSIDVTIAGGYLLGGVRTLWADAIYTRISDPSGAVDKIIIGTTAGDPISYYSNTTHRFRSANASTIFAELSSSGLYLPSGLGINLGHASDTTITRAAAGVIAVEGVPLYANLPQNSKSADYTLVLGDAQKHIIHPSSDATPRTFTIPANASVAYDVGTAVTFINQDGAGALTIAITSDTMRMAGLGSTGSRTLAANGIATAIKVASTEWIISGVNLT